MRYRFLCFPVLCICWLAACKRRVAPATAFYYWKTSFDPDSARQQLLHEAADNRLYLHFFDIDRVATSPEAAPAAVIRFQQPVTSLLVTPVVFITNRVFEQMADSATDSLAFHTAGLINQIATREKISFTAIQIDCDWTLTTRDNYFRYLRALKALSHKQLQATIRLHQVKYKERTGVPPVDTGILMFYNMGKLDAGIAQASSIYNEADAAKYVAALPRYPLPLHVALPVFSWAVHTRSGKVIQLYSSIGRKQLANTANFEQVAKQAYRARKSFFAGGVYIKENDIFKLEETGRKIAEKAARQLAAYLPPLHQRTIIYYELSTLDLEEYQAKDIIQLSGCF